MNETEPTLEVAPIPGLAHWINLVAIPVAFATVACNIADIHSPIRTWLTLLLFLFGAGSGITQFLRLSEPAFQFGMIATLSIAADLLVSQALLSVHNLNGSAAACILAGITCIRPLYIRGSVVKDVDA